MGKDRETEGHGAWRGKEEEEANGDWSGKGSTEVRIKEEALERETEVRYYIILREA